MIRKELRMAWGMILADLVLERHGSLNECLKELDGKFNLLGQITLSILQFFSDRPQTW